MQDVLSLLREGHKLVLKEHCFDEYDCGDFGYWIDDEYIDDKSDLHHQINELRNQDIIVDGERQEIDSWNAETQLIEAIS